jgi:hypothetical protein
MREMLCALGCKMGILHPCGTLEVSWTDDNCEGPFTIGGPSFRITEKGIEGPIYPSIWEDLGWVPKVESPQLSGEMGSVPPEGESALLAEPEQGEEHPGAA